MTGICSAEFFCKNWSSEVESAEFLFTRSLEGRATLLRQRFQAMMKKTKQIQHIHKWVRENVRILQLDNIFENIRDSFRRNDICVVVVVE